MKYYSSANIEIIIADFLNNMKVFCTVIWTNKKRKLSLIKTAQNIWFSRIWMLKNIEMIKMISNVVTIFLFEGEKCLWRSAYRFLRQKMRFIIIICQQNFTIVMIINAIGIFLILSITNIRIFSHFIYIHLLENITDDFIH